MKYRKKPVEVEAVKWEGGKEQYELIMSLAPKDTVFYREQEAAFDIYTLEGVMRASLGDYIIKGVQGEFYPCKPDIFEQTYEKVEE